MSHKEDKKGAIVPDALASSCKSQNISKGHNEKSCVRSHRRRLRPVRLSDSIIIYCSIAIQQFLLLVNICLSAGISLATFLCILL